MKKILLILIPLMVAGCTTVDQIDYFPNGKVKSEYHQSGFCGFSEGAGKNMPLANPSFSVIGSK
jgi:Na+-translocating ferredoxin:NAD+ oxidoreductase RnfE subunit